MVIMDKLDLKYRSRIRISYFVLFSCVVSCQKSNSYVLYSFDKMIFVFSDSLQKMSFVFFTDSNKWFSCVVSLRNNEFRICLFASKNDLCCFISIQKMVFVIFIASKK